MTLVDRGLEFTRRGDVSLRGDLYRPEGGGPHPVLVAVPGGAWLKGDKAQLANWALYFARNGIAVFAIDYQRATAGPAFPDNVRDVLNASRFLCREAADLSLDAERMGLLGASAGAHLSALAALAQGRSWDAGEAVAFKLLIAVYGVYDLTSHWQADLDKNAPTQTDPTVRMLGVAPFEDQGIYFEASPLRHVTYDRNQLKVMLVWGEADRDVLPAQSEAFARALRQARFIVRTQVVPGAGHFWFSEDSPEDFMSPNALVAPAALRFVRQHLS